MKSAVRNRRWPGVAVPLVAFLLLIAAPVAVHAQSCSLCYTQAAAANARFIQALRSGILILMVPPMIMSIGITVVAYKRRNS